MKNRITITGIIISTLFLTHAATAQHISNPGLFDSPKHKKNTKCDKLYQQSQKGCVGLIRTLKDMNRQYDYTCKRFAEEVRNECERQIDVSRENGR
jgi:hypothetical protein